MEVVFCSPKAGFTFPSKYRGTRGSSLQLTLTNSILPFIAEILLSICSCHAPYNWLLELCVPLLPFYIFEYLEF